MSVSVRGPTGLFSQLCEKYPNYMDEIGHGSEDDPINYDLVSYIVSLGLQVRINDIIYGSEGPYMEIPIDESDEDFDEYDEYY